MVLFVIVALLVGGLWLVGRRMQRRPRYRYSPMLLIVGLPGAGKTYKLVQMMVRRLAEGRHVRVNFNVRWDRLYIALRMRHGLSPAEARAALSRVGFLDTFEDILDAVDCDVFIDEAQDLLNSAEWQVMPHEVIQWFAQHRHRQCRIIVTTHRFGALHNYVRELIGEIELARPAPWFVRAAVAARPGVTVLQYLQIHDAEEGALGGTTAGAARKRGVLLNLSSLTVDRVIAEVYDTHGGVRMSPMARIREARRREGERFVLTERTWRAGYSQPVDGLPALSPEEVVAFIPTGGAAAELQRRLYAA